MITIEKLKVLAKKANQITEISATVHDDRHLKEIKFNAIEYFGTITDPLRIKTNDSIAAWKQLIECEFSGDYAADDVALFYQSSTTADVFEATGGDNGFSCSINEENAIAYLLQNNELVFDMLCHHNDLDLSSLSLSAIEQYFSKAASTTLKQRCLFEMEIDVKFLDKEKAEAHFIDSDWKESFNEYFSLGELAEQLAYVFHIESSRWNSDHRAFTKFVEGFGLFVENDQIWHLKEDTETGGIVITYNEVLDKAGSFEIKE